MKASNLLQGFTFFASPKKVTKKKPFSKELFDTKCRIPKMTLLKFEMQSQRLAVAPFYYRLLN